MTAHWHAVAASVKGTSHEKTMQPCQDASAKMVMKSGLFAAAVSDGAGSASRSDLGAQQAVNQALQYLYFELQNEGPQTAEDWGELLRSAFLFAREQVSRLPDAEGGELRDYACTFTLVLADHEWLVTGQVGDGLAVAQAANGELHIVADPQRGEYADSTYFLTSPNAEDIFTGRVYRQGVDIDSITGLAVMTDGLTHLAINQSAKIAHAPFFSPLMRFPLEITDKEKAQDELYAFLSSERVNQRTADDKTLVIAARADQTQAIE